MTGGRIGAGVGLACPYLKNENKFRSIFIYSFGHTNCCWSVGYDYFGRDNTYTRCYSVVIGAIMDIKKQYELRFRGSHKF